MRKPANQLLTRRRGPRVRRQQARSVVTQARLLDAARDLFSREGYAGVSRADVARRAGYGMSTVYHHFPEKRDMLLQLIDEWGKTMPVERRAALDIRVALDGHLHQAARDFLKRSYDQLRKGPSFYRVILTEAERDPEVRRRFELAQQTVVHWIAEMVRLGQQAGVVRANVKPDAAAFLINNLVESCLTELVTQRVTDPLREEILDEFADMVAWYIRGNPEDRDSPAGGS